jgi:protein-tyrosine phosphatase
MVKVFLLGMNC